MEIDKVYVAIGKEVEERESILNWVLKDFKAINVCVIFVHVPAKRIPLPSGLELPVRLIRKNELEAFRANEIEEVLQILDDCSKMCATFQVPCETVYVEKDSIIEGILELIYQLKVEKLVMGAAANHKYRSGMTKLISEKAKNVLQFAPDICHVWFICKDHLIYKREGVTRQSPEFEELPLDSSEMHSSSDSGILLRQASLTRLKHSELSRHQRSPAKPYLSSNFSHSQSLPVKPQVSDPELASISLVSLLAKEDVNEQNDGKFSIVPQSYQHLGSSSPSESSINGTLHNKFEQSITEAESSWREAFRESVSCWIAEKQALEAIRKAKPVERLYHEELKLKIEMQEEAQNRKKIFSKAKLELSKALDHKMSLESQVEKFNLEVTELKEKVVSETQMSQKYKNECNKLQLERDDALGEAQELRKQLAQGPPSSFDPMFTEFTYLELQKATKDLDPCLIIGQGSYGSTYKGFLHHTEVAIKLLVPNSVHNLEHADGRFSKFEEQVGLISKLRHPNLVTLIGACREPWALVYEYLPGGTLELRLTRQKNILPLPWQLRIRIAMDICSALIFLHSAEPTCTAHQDLTPVKLLLDANLTCKLTDFGVGSEGTSSVDVCSFGIIVLQLLTGRQEVLGIAKEVAYALSKGTLQSILDPSAGEWPYIQAKQLAHMALRCCDLENNNRPDLATSVWRVLAPMRASSSSLFSFPLASHDQPPHYFICPILQEIMEDPHFAADGFTYEAEAIRAWFESDHDTSPMTNMKLSSLNLTPNRALRSVIQEWLQLTSTKTLDHGSDNHAPNCFISSLIKGLMESNKVYVAIGKEVEEIESTLRWVSKRKAVTRQGPQIEETPFNSCEMNNEPDSGIFPRHVSLTRLRHSESIGYDYRPAKAYGSSTKPEAFRKIHSCCKPNKQTTEAIHKGKPIERLYSEELRLKKVMKEEAENMEGILAEVSLEISETLDYNNMLLESQAEKFNLKVELEKKLFSEIKLSHKYKDERSKLRMERDGALGETQELRKQLSQRPSIPVDPLFSKFSQQELLKATNNFDPSLKIGQDDYGSMYKGLLHQIEVSIKLLAPNRVKNHQEFNKQVICILRLQHPNVVTLIGACRKPWALIYEYLPCGTLEDRLIHHNDNVPIPWQIRIRIAVDICSALTFVHSIGIVHGDLTPKKLLLDANFTCQISGFGVVSTDTSSDVFSFGIIVLYLLTGKHASLAIAKEVECTLMGENFDRMLDPSAGEWPYVQAKQLAHIAVRCCDMNIPDRPDLVSDVWRVLAPMRASCSRLSSFLMASHVEPPHYFICPILQETMEDPYFAADGFTYEAEAIRGWLESGHDTSPMTNMKLANHYLVPNRALRSVIQEWRQSTSTK